MSFKILSSEVIITTLILFLLRLYEILYEMNALHGISQADNVFRKRN